MLYNLKNKPVNTYYRQNLPSGMDVVLTSSGEHNEIILRLEGTQRGQYASCVLSEKEQDDLIVGILERRGTEKTMGFISKLMADVPDEKWIAYITKEGNIADDAISSNGEQQSKIHPANKTVENKS